MTTDFRAGKMASKVWPARPGRAATSRKLQAASSSCPRTALTRRSKLAACSCCNEWLLARVCPTEPRYTAAPF